MRLAALLVALVPAIAPGPMTAEPLPDGIASERGLKGFVKLDRLPTPADPVLLQGREIWGDVCFKCHGGNRAVGAPKITSTWDWTDRIDQGVDVLFTHAIQGFTGPKFTPMPARGGRASLSDAEVQAAVLFMIWASGGAEIVAEHLAN